MNTNIKAKLCLEKYHRKLFSPLYTLLPAFLKKSRSKEDHRNSRQEIFQDSFSKITSQRLGFFTSISAVSHEDLYRKGHRKKYLRFAFWNSFIKGNYLSSILQKFLTQLLLLSRKLTALFLRYYLIFQ